MIVADTNLLIYLYIQGQWTEESEAVLQLDALWAMPFLWRSEFRNSLRGLVRAHVLQLDDALTMLDEAERWLNGREYNVLSRQVLTLASRSGCSAYDCELVA